MGLMKPAPTGRQQGSAQSCAASKSGDFDNLTHRIVARTYHCAGWAAREREYKSPTSFLCFRPV